MERSLEAAQNMAARWVQAWARRRPCAGETWDPGTGVDMDIVVSRSWRADDIARVDTALCG